jgi:RHS repeat-associated protein
MRYPRSHKRRTGKSPAQHARGAGSPWGETRHQGGTPPSDYGYTGQREEAGIGLYYYNARWYDAKLGRFAQADAIVPEVSKSGSFDRYSYTFNNPIRYSDPTGNFSEDEICRYWGYCGEDARSMMEQDYGKILSDIMWSEEITFGDVIYLNFGDGKTLEFMFILVESAAGIFRPVAMTKTGSMYESEDLKGAVTAKTGVGIHRNEDGSYSYFGDISSTKAEEMIANGDIYLFTWEDVEYNEYLFQKGYYRDYNEIYFATFGATSALALGTLGLSFWASLGAATLGIGVGYVLDIFVKGPVDRTYPILVEIGAPGGSLLWGGFLPPGEKF